MFAVFGKSKEMARQKAHKESLPNHADGAPKTLDEVINSINERAESLYEAMRPTRISPIYATKGICEEFIGMLDKQNNSGISIKQSFQGEKSKKTGKHSVKWKIV